MTKNIFINNLIEKYVEVYQRALDAGFQGLEAHQVAAKFFNEGFQGLKEVK